MLVIRIHIHIHSDVPKIMKIRMQNTAGHTAGAHVYVAFLTSPHGGSESEHDRVVRQLIDRAPRVEEPMFTLQPVMVLCVCVLKSYCLMPYIIRAALGAGVAIGLHCKSVPTRCALDADVLVVHTVVHAADAAGVPSGCTKCRLQAGGQLEPQ